MNSRHWITLSAACFFLLCPLFPAFANPSPEENLSVEELLSMPLEKLVELEVSLATGLPKPLRLAPAVATVITAEDIERLGATTLNEALETVPGLHVEPSALNRLTPIFSIRGIHTSTNPHVLLLVNGVSFKDPYNGAVPPTFGMATANISRIEVVRGPGSALYGADAFSGTINIITKDAKEINGLETGLRLGSFATVDSWLQYGGELRGWDVAVGVELQKSSGDDDRVIDRDALGNAPPSMAPGAIETNYNNVDSNLRLQKDNWAVDMYGSWQNDNAMGPGAQRLAPGSEEDNMSLLGSITYTNSQLADDWDLGARLSGSYLDIDALWMITPPSAGGFIGNPKAIDKACGFDVYGIYNAIDRHALRLGAGLNKIEHESDHNRNFLVIPVTTALGDMINVKGTQHIYMDDQSRKLWYLLAQDEWSINTKWELTAGARYDSYSDFGSTTNPRAALVWETRPDLTSKLLYGRAFRAPSFGSLYAKSNNVAVGNKDLEPEEIETWELAFDYQPRPDLQTTINLFTYEIDGLIELVGGIPKVSQNSKDQEAYGFEIAAKWQARDNLLLQANLARQRSKDKATRAIVAEAPGLQYWLNAHWLFAPRWSLDIQYNRVGDRKRESGDIRPEIDDYGIVNLVLRRKGIAKHWGFAVGVKDLLDDKGRIPSPYDTAAVLGAFIPNDIPMEGRSVWTELRYSF